MHKRIEFHVFVGIFLGFTREGMILSLSTTPCFDMNNNSKVCCLLSFSISSHFHLIQV